MASNHGNVAHLLNPNFKTDVTRWIAEDCPSFDYGGFVVGDGPGEARLLAKSEGVLAGVPFFEEIFRQFDCSVHWLYPEGTHLKPDSSSPKIHVATVKGSIRHLLLGERIALNTLARCSGVASQSARLLSRIKTHVGSLENCPIIAGTRKTTPGFRVVEKYGMLIGGIDPHRYDLSAMTMLKDNHVVAAGSITKAVHAAKAVGGFAVKVEVECQSEDEAIEAIRAGADIVMLDNFEPEDVPCTTARLKRRFGCREKRAVPQGFTGDSSRWDGGDVEVEKLEKRKDFLIEISGGLNENNVEAYLEKNASWRGDVDILSTSSVHQGVKTVDFSLKVVKQS